MKETQTVRLNNVEVAFAAIHNPSQYGRTLIVNVTESEAKMLRDIEGKLTASMRSKRNPHSIVKEKKTDDGNVLFRVKAKISPDKTINGSGKTITMVDSLGNPVSVDPFSGSTVNVVLFLAPYDVAAVGGAGVSAHLLGLQVVKNVERKASPLFGAIVPEGGSLF